MTKICVPLGQWAVATMRLECTARPAHHRGPPSCLTGRVCHAIQPLFLGLGFGLAAGFSNTPFLCLPQIMSPFHVYFNWKLIMQRRELWRLFTNFFFFGNLGESGDNRIYPKAASL